MSNYYKRIINITVLILGTVMFFSCKTDIKTINELTARDDSPEVSGEVLTLFYSDSARIKYKIEAPIYNKYNFENERYGEFPEGIKAILYNTEGKEVGSIVSKYAKQFEDTELWELRDDVVAVNEDGRTLETDLLYWDMKEERVYSDRYTRLTSGEQIIDGHGGFESDQQLLHPVFKNVTGKVEIESAE